MMKFTENLLTHLALNFIGSQNGSQNKGTKKPTGRRSLKQKNA